MAALWRVCQVSKFWSVEFVRTWIKGAVFIAGSHFISASWWFSQVSSLLRLSFSSGLEMASLYIIIDFSCGVIYVDIWGAVHERCKTCTSLRWRFVCDWWPSPTEMIGKFVCVLSCVVCANTFDEVMDDWWVDGTHHKWWDIGWWCGSLLVCWTTVDDLLVDDVDVSVSSNVC